MTPSFAKIVSNRTISENDHNLSIQRYLRKSFLGTSLGSMGVLIVGEKCREGQTGKMVRIRDLKDKLGGRENKLKQIEKKNELLKKQLENEKKEREKEKQEIENLQKEVEGLKKSKKGRSEEDIFRSIYEIPYSVDE